MKTIKKTTLLLITAIIFTACSATEEDNNDQSNKINYQQSNFSISIPRDWEIVEKEQFTSKVPQNTVVAFRNNIKNEEFTANLNITQSIVDPNLTSEDFAKSNISKIQNRLVNFQQTANSNYKLPINEENSIPTLITTFQGKQKASSPIIQFKQLSISQNGIGHTITGSYLSNEEESIVKQIDEMLNSFRLTQQGV